MALGDYRGPKSAKAFMRYAEVRMDQHDEGAFFRVYVAEHLRALVGSPVGYFETVMGKPAQDFDPDEVVDDVLARIGTTEDGTWTS